MSDPTRSIAAIYERYHQSLYRFCFSIVGNAEDAQDALQNAMLKAIRALPGEQREIQLKPWLYRIAHNESIEILRKRREEAQIDPELVASTAGPEEAAATRERLQRLLADISALPERQRGALVMRELAGLGFGEIGEALGTSEAVARQTVYEARLGLHQLEAGREMSCASVMRQISDADGRTMRRRDIRAHLRACPECRNFREAIEGRSRDLAAIAPLPAAASAGILHALLGSAGSQAGAGAGAAGTASTIGAGAGKAVATSAVLKSAATVAVVAALGVGTADRAGVVNLGLPGDSGRTSSRTASSAGGEASGGTDSSGTAAAKNSAIASGAIAGKQALKSAGADGQAATAKGDGSPNRTTGFEDRTGHGHNRGAGLPAASQHGQETSAAHKATLQASPTHGHAHGAGTHSSRGGRGHVRSHQPVRSHGSKSHSHGGTNHSHSGGRSGGTPAKSPSPPPPPAESPQTKPSAPAPATPETQVETESAEG